MSFIAAATAESQEVWACFFDHGFDVNSVEFGSSALSLSTAKPELVKWLLDSGADPNLKMRPDSGRSLLLTAARTALVEDDVESMRILIAHGAVLENDFLEDCVPPSSNNKISAEVTQLMLSSGLDPNLEFARRGGTPLQLAVRKGMTDKAKVLLQAGANITVVNADGDTPLEEAISLAKWR